MASRPGPRQKAPGPVQTLLTRACDALRRLRRDPLYRNSAALVANFGVTAACAFLFWTLAARTVTTAEVGLVTATTNYGLLIGTLGCLGLPNALIRYLPRAGGRGRGFLWWVLATTQAMTLVITGLLLISPFAPPAAHANSPAPLAVLAFMLSLAASMIMDASLLAVRRGPAIVAKNALVGLSRIVALLAVPMMANPVSQLLWIQTLTAAAGAVLGAGVLLIRFLPRDHSTPDLAGLVAYSSSNYLAMVVGIMPVAATPVLVLRLAGAEVAAFFSISLMLVGLLNVFASSMGQSMFAEAQYGRTPEQLIRSAARSLVVIVVPGVVVFTVLAPLLLWAFGDKYAAESTSALRIMAIGAIPAAASYLGDAYFNGRGDGRSYLLLNLQNSVLVLGLVGVGATQSLTMAALGWTAGQLLSAAVSIASVLLSRRPIPGHELDAMSVGPERK